MSSTRPANWFLNGTVSLLLMLAFLPGCNRSGQPAGAGDPRPSVMAVNYPLAAGVDLLAGDFVRLNYPVPAEDDPAYWSPDEATVLEMQRVDILFLNGAGHEPWESQVTLSPLNRAVTSLGFRDHWIEVEDATAHQHGPEGEHSHTKTAFTVWLDPNLYEEQLRVIARGLQRALPERRDKIEERFNAAVERLQALDKRWDKASVKLMTAPVIGSHPVYQYLAERYDWRLKSVHWEPDQTPTDEQWAEFDELLEEHPAELMIWEAEPNEEIQRQLQARKIRSVVVAPLSNVSASENILDAMEENAAAFEQAVEELTSAPDKSTAD